MQWPLCSECCPSLRLFWRSTQVPVPVHNVEWTAALQLHCASRTPVIAESSISKVNHDVEGHLTNINIKELAFMKFKTSTSIAQYIEESVNIEVPNFYIQISKYQSFLLRLGQRNFFDIDNKDSSHHHSTSSISKFMVGSVLDGCPTLQASVLYGTLIVVYVVQ